jgi:BASS family bile acid:Na+ symporter
MIATGRLLRNRNFILILAIVLGLAIGEQGATKTEFLVLPLLALVITLSAINITSRELVSLKAMPRAVIYSLLLNYVVLGGIILIMASWLITDYELWIGFVVLAAVPPSVAVVPFSYVLDGDALFSLIGMTGAYMAALAVMPAAMVLFLGIEFFDPVKLLLILGELILVPILASRILLLAGVGQHIRPWRGTIVNWSFFIALFTIVGLNRQAFFQEFDVLARIGAIAIVITFVLGYVLELIARVLHLGHRITVSVILMGTLKNYAMAGGILLALFGERSSIPPSICVVFGVLLVVWLGFRFRKRV